MLITIIPKTLSFGAQYSISIDNVPTYRAHSPVFTWKKTVLIIKDGEREPVACITRKVVWLKARFLIVIGQNVWEWYSESFSHGLYRCRVDQDLYEIIAHKGHKHTITKNFIQVAWWDKDATWLQGAGNYRMQIDRDADHLLAIAFCLIVDTKNRERGEGLAFDMGYAGWGRPPFDEQWRAKP